jgi:hypothetical protein
MLVISIFKLGTGDTLLLRHARAICRESEIDDRCRVERENWPQQEAADNRLAERGSDPVPLSIMNGAAF